MYKYILFLYSTKYLVELTKNQHKFLHKTFNDISYGTKGVFSKIILRKERERVREREIFILF